MKCMSLKKNLMKRPFPFFCSYQQLFLRQDEDNLNQELRWNRSIFGVKKSGISFYRLVSKCLFDPCNKKIKKNLKKVVQSFKKILAISDVQRGFIQIVGNDSLIN